MVDREVLDARLAKLEEVLAHLRALSKTQRDEFLGSAPLQAQAERWLQVAAECAIDSAHHIIADRGWATPSSNREAFEIVTRHAVLSPDLGAQMATLAGLRNVLTHLYLEIDHAAIYRILQDDLGALEDYAGAVTRFADEDPA